jgi:hypothetical protein
MYINLAFKREEHNKVYEMFAATITALHVELINY